MTDEEGYWCRCGFWTDSDHEWDEHTMLCAGRPDVFEDDQPCACGFWSDEDDEMGEHRIVCGGWPDEYDDDEVG